MSESWRLAINDLFAVFVRSDDKLIRTLRHAVAKVFAHHPVQITIFQPAIGSEQGIQPLTLIFVGGATDNGLPHLLCRSGLIREDIVDDVLGRFGTNGAVHRKL